jgi:hypothetical protein
MVFAEDPAPVLYRTPTQNPLHHPVFHEFNINSTAKQCLQQEGKVDLTPQRMCTPRPHTNTQKFTTILNNLFPTWLIYSEQIVQSTISCLIGVHFLLPTLPYTIQALRVPLEGVTT